MAIARFNSSFCFSKTFSRKRSSPPPPNFAPPFCAFCLIICDFLPKTWNLGRKEGKSVLSGSHSFAVPYLRPKRVCKGFFRAFWGDSMHFRGHSRRIAPLLPPFVVYYKHRAVLCSICHSHNSYRAENRPVTANRAVFCFLRVRVVHRVVSAHLRGDSCPKPSKAGKTWYTGYNKKRPAWKGA